MPAMNTETKVARWTLISLRPRGQHAPLRRAAKGTGATLIALSPWALQARRDATTCVDLAAALAAERVVFSSPAAVHAAARLAALDAPHVGQWLAVGAGTAAALARHGARDVLAPGRMDSEGLLALPALADLRGLRAGLVTAPGGRGVIADTLQQRGAQLLRANVYARHPLPLAARTLQRLRRSALSSGEALSLLLEQLPADLQVRLRSASVAAASERLATQARAAGFLNVTLAAGPLPAQLVSAAHAALMHPASS